MLVQMGRRNCLFQMVNNRELILTEEIIDKYPVKMIFFRTILSGSTLLKEPTAATDGGEPPFPSFRTIRGSGGKDIGA